MAASDPAQTNYLHEGGRLHDMQGRGTGSHEICYVGSPSSLNIQAHSIVGRFFRKVRLDM